LTFTFIGKTKNRYVYYYIRSKPAVILHQSPSATISLYNKPISLNRIQSISFS